MSRISEEFINFVDTLIYGILADLDGGNVLNDLKNIYNHFNRKIKSREFYYGYYVGMIISIATFAFNQKYGRQPDRDEFNQMLDEIQDKSEEIKNELEKMSMEWM